MITNDKLNTIILECQSSGYKVKIRDIAYLLLCRSFEDYKLAYKSIYGAECKDEDIEKYDESKEISFLRTYLDVNFKDKSKNKKTISGSDDDITFEENKAEIIRLIKQTQESLADGKIDAKQALELQTKLRVTLNDKFNVKNEEQKEQIIVVQQKYDSICPYCNKEVAARVISEEEAMLMYNLVKNNEKFA